MHGAGEGRHSHSHDQTHKRKPWQSQLGPSGLRVSLDLEETNGPAGGAGFSSSRLLSPPGPAPSAHLPEPRPRHAANRRAPAPPRWAGQRVKAGPGAEGSNRRSILLCARGGERGCSPHP